MSCTLPLFVLIFHDFLYVKIPNLDNFPQTLKAYTAMETILEHNVTFMVLAQLLVRKKRYKLENGHRQINFPFM